MEPGGAPIGKGDVVADWKYGCWRASIADRRSAGSNFKRRSSKSKAKIVASGLDKRSGRG